MPFPPTPEAYPNLLDIHGNRLRPGQLIGITPGLPELRHLSAVWRVALHSSGSRLVMQPELPQELQASPLQECPLDAFEAAAVFAITEATGLSLASHPEAWLKFARAGWHIWLESPDRDPGMIRLRGWHRGKEWQMYSDMSLSELRHVEPAYFFEQAFHFAQQGPPISHN